MADETNSTAPAGETTHAAAPAAAAPYTPRPAGGPGGPGGARPPRTGGPYRDVRLLQGFVAERGKIVPRRLTGVCTRHQRKLSLAIKQSRNIALLAFAARF